MNIQLDTAMPRHLPFHFCVRLALKYFSFNALFSITNSGSTGTPKGVLHTTAGYLIYAATTFKYVFDYHPGDVYWCTADVGWITGHTYVVYGPLANGATSVIVSQLFDLILLDFDTRLLGTLTIACVYKLVTAKNGQMAVRTKCMILVCSFISSSKVRRSIRATTGTGRSSISTRSRNFTRHRPLLDRS